MVLNLGPVQFETVDAYILFTTNESELRISCTGSFSLECFS